ncbi:NAD(P)/FAD-dependent oxidoreductase [Gluconobacter sp. Dm-62]|uniref:NAD(P)-binding domain-containing protein n=1 Tax=Gluconobacter sp. Dm-62 TaxID=2799804 RepID=UPI001B8C4FF6|nr:NAD(P)/FAD-dependent oxidoreductase [Gluconobacter sp. Dm-62]MBS1101618.1 NAD(P)/FAD-dependent oxidoreductase [Gluconobacter sp. Dm-62]
MTSDALPQTDHALADLTARVRDDLDRIAHPRRPWTFQHEAPSGEAMLDVLIVGGGQSGLAAAFGLMRDEVRNILVVDQAPRGLEGPWLSYARMHTLRSPKDFTGPDLDIPSLTYQSWHEAKFGPQSWTALHLITKQHWVEYLLWLRDTVGIPVQNDTTVLDIEPCEGGLCVLLQSAGAEPVRRFTRKVVLATGQESLGRWSMPGFIEALPARVRAHTAEGIDFAALRGKRVAILGAGASAFDNAATALEAGAGEVHLFCRRAEPQLVQPYLWLTFTGFLKHFSELDDVWKWRFMNYILGLREGFPQPTWDRCAKHMNFRLYTGAGWNGAAMDGEKVLLDTAQGPFEADYVICATGIEHNPAQRPELARAAENIARWEDRFTPAPDEQNSRLSAFPYLGNDYTLQERVPGETPWLRNIHLFSIAATMSFGPSGSSINAMKFSVPKLVSGITGALFRDDVEAYWQDLKGYDIRQAELRWPAGHPMTLEDA